MGVKVAGLDDFRRELRRADPALKEALKRVHKDLAEWVLEGARARSRKSHVKKAITARGSQRAAELAMLKSRAEDVFGDEFGSHKYKQFPPWRGNQWTDPKGLRVGYMLHPEIRARSDEISRHYLDMVEKAMAATAFPD
jgi:hypothetical protein